VLDWQKNQFVLLSILNIIMETFVDIPSKDIGFDARPFKSNLIGVFGDLVVATTSIRSFEQFVAAVTPLLVELLSNKAIRNAAEFNGLVVSCEKHLKADQKSREEIGGLLFAQLSPCFDNALLAKLQKSGDVNSLKAANLIQSLRYATSLIEVPLGALSLIRQHLFLDGVFAGPVEHAFTVGPGETVEVRMETQKRTTFEQSQTETSSSEQQKSAEQKNSSEVTDKLSQAISRSSSSTVSASVSGSYGVVSGSISGSQSVSDSSTASREFATRQMSETVNKVSESMARSFSVSSKSTQDFLESNSYRREVVNSTSEPINYGLRRLFQRLTIKQQQIGSALVWKKVIADPSNTLGKGRLLNKQLLEGTAESFAGPPPIHSAKPYDLAWENVPPVIGLALFSLPYSAYADFKIGGARGIKDIVSVRFEGGSPTKDLLFESQDTMNSWMLRCEVQAITEISPAGKEPGGLFSPARIRIEMKFSLLSAKGDPNWLIDYDTFKYRMISELIVTLASARYFHSSGESIKEANATLGAWAEAIQDESQTIRRPPDDLRKEERIVLVTRILSELIGGVSPTVDYEQEVKAFSEIFDLDQFFTEPITLMNRFDQRARNYFVTSTSSSRFGSALSWDIQPDVDDARNAFMNCPYIIAYVPIKAGRERAAANYLKLKKQLGLVDPNALDGLLVEFEDRRLLEKSFPLEGPNDVFSASPPLPPVGTPSLKDVYPTYREFETSIPIDGFVYEKLNIV
jgi:hypothetical protein